MVQWLDLANAYGSIPHKPLEVVLTCPHTAGKTKAPFWTGTTTLSEWHKLDKGTGMTGCSTGIHFTPSMIMLVRGPAQA